MSAWTLLPVLLLSSPRIALRVGDVERVLALALIVPFVMTAASPGIAHFTADNVKPAQAQQALLARQIEEQWHAVALTSLRYVDGDMDLAYGVVASAADKPHAIPGLPPPPAAVLKRDGFVFVCLTEDAACIARGKTIAASEPEARIIESTIFRTTTGRQVAPQRYTIVLVPPGR
jgi:hypothetical protein